MAQRGREFAALGKVLVNQPREFPAAVVTLVRRSLRTVWDARGGGLYACGFVIAFIWLEINMLVGDFSASSGLVDFFGGQIIEVLLRFTVQSMVNSIQALLWPLAVIDMAPPWGAIGLAALYVAFPRYLKRPLERLLFEDDEAVDNAPDDADSASREAGGAEKGR